MSLVTTPGAVNADSYVSVMDADAYFSARGVTAWIGSEADREAALRRATDYLENTYRGRWVGTRTTRDQALAWPRIDGSGHAQLLEDADGFDLPDNVVPKNIQCATAEVALLLLQGVNLQPRLVRGGAIKRSRVKAGPVEKETEYQDGAPAVDRLLMIEGLLRTFVTSMPGVSGGNVRLVRA